MEDIEAGEPDETASAFTYKMEDGTTDSNFYALFITNFM